MLAAREELVKNSKCDPVNANEETGKFGWESLLQIPFMT